MKRRFFFLTIGLSCLGWTNNLLAQFTNLDFESAYLPMFVDSVSWPAYESMPGWTVSCGIVEGEFAYLVSGPIIGVWVRYINGGTWFDAQGQYYVTLNGGATISQTGYLSPSTRSLRFRSDGLGVLGVSFAGETLSCVAVSSNSECAADISKFAGTTGELKFTSATWVDLDSIWFSDQSVSNLPPTAPTVSVSKTTDSSLRLTFPAQLGTTCLIQATTNLLNWETIGSVQATNDPTEVFDSLASIYNMRYYRVVVPP